jgi:hypothetical protein
MQEERKEMPKRCCFDGCKKKLGLTGFACRCGDYYCSAHRSDEVHHCSYDYRGENMKHLSSMLVKVNGTKIDVI